MYKVVLQQCINCKKLIGEEGEGGGKTEDENKCGCDQS
jgi:hypothetical protein